MELSLTGIKMSIDLGRAVSIVADGIPPPLRFHIGGRRQRDLPDSARYVDDRHFQVVSAVGK